MQPIIISQGTSLSRIKFAEELIKKTFSIETDYSSHMDFKQYEVAEDKKLIAIEQVRDLIREINIKPRINDKKVILIKEAQALSVEAQNALLKTLEEPPAYSQIILTVDHHENLIPTVISRCIIKDLNLTARVDLDSADYAELKEEFLKILSMDIGQKIDWVTDNKNRIKDREEIMQLLNNWEAVLRDRMIDEISSKNNPEVWAERIKLIQKIKRYIQSNANASLAIESLLLNL